MRPFVLLLIFISVHVTGALSQSRTAYTAVSAYGDWSNPSTWRDNIVPVPGAGYDTVIIDEDAGVFITSSMTFNGVIIVKNQLDILGVGTTLSMDHNSWIRIESFPFPTLMFDPTESTRATQSVQIGSLTYPGSDAFYTDTILGPCYITAGGTGSDWETTATWSDNLGDSRLPAAGDSIIIPAGVDVHIPASTTIDLTGKKTVVMVYGTLELDGDSDSELVMDGGTGNHIYIHTYNTTTGDGALEVVGPVIQNGSSFSAAADPEPGTDGLGDANTVGGYGKVIDGAWTTLSSPLPVKLRFFRAQVISEAVQLLWQSYEEIDFDAFEVQRSVDGIRFDKIAHVPGKGGAEVATYEFVDWEQFPGMRFYRLKSLDLDGTYEYSKIVSVAGQIQARAGSVFPNPVQGDHFRLSPWPGNGEITKYWIVNALGELVERGEMTHSSNDISFPKDTRPGIYFIKVRTMSWEKSWKILKE